MGERIEFYWLPHCTTCQKAARFLEERGIALEQRRDLKMEPLTRAEVERLARLVGGARELFSKRARKYRALGLDKRELSDDEMLRLMEEEYTFIKRPVLIIGERAIAGFTPKAYERFLQG
jgi:arsenate reductase